jgi:hydroxypyruvate reductase
VPDQTTWSDAAAALARYGGESHAPSVKALMSAGLAGVIADTPKIGDPTVARTLARVIGSRVDAMEGARVMAAQRGYHAVVIPEAVTGEARTISPAWFSRMQATIAHAPRPACVISSGETTVRVTGTGRGGRNLEFALALVHQMASLRSAAFTSIGTDGIDGSSGVAGGIVDSSTLVRAVRAGLQPPGNYLAANDSLAFFSPLDDVVRLGRTDTNVGDLQVLLIE